VAKVIYDPCAKTSYTTEVREEIAFITKVFSDPITYRWESPIAHLIDRENNYKVVQDSCLTGASGFLALLWFWWSFLWPDEIIKRTRLPRNSIHCISINLLEYGALIVGLAGSIVAWESLPTNPRPAHLMILLLTENTTAKSWTKRISGLKTPQGRTLAWLFAHILMFLDVGILAEHIAGEDNVVANYLSRTKNTNNLPAFSFKILRTKFPWLSSSRCF
jgi:hypothetical protein